MKRAALLLAVLAFAILPALAGEKHDPAYYQRTGTKPPSKVEGVWLVGFGVNYVDKLGAGGTVGYHFDNTGITLLGSVSAIQLRGENGISDFRKFCQTFAVPYSTGDRTEAEFGFNVLFTLDKRK